MDNGQRTVKKRLSLSIVHCPLSIALWAASPPRGKIDLEMITYLKVRNLAIVEELAIEPGPGLNVLTGETGAGKSLLIDSIELLSGARGSSEMIRAGSDRMTAEAVLELPAAVQLRLEELGVTFDPASRGELIVRRELSAGGRGRVLVNGSPLSVRELSAVMELLLEIHGQSQSHQKIAGQGFREMLDEYGGHAEGLGSTATAFDSWRRSAEQLAALRAAQQDRTLRLDLLAYQIDEIAAARLIPGEEDALRGERSMLAHAQELIASTSGAFAVVSDDEDSALAQLDRALHLLQPLAREIPEVEASCGELRDLTYRLQEMGRTLARLSESARHDPARLEEVEERLVTLERLVRKYGGSTEAVLAHLAAVEDEFERLQDYEQNLVKLEQQEEVAFRRYSDVATALSTLRRTAAEKFQRAIQSQLDDLAMERTTVRIDLTRARDSDSRLRLGEEPVAFGPSGYDRVEILIAPNRGEDLRSVQRIASGGELSRIRLAIAAALVETTRESAGSTLIFDEIDAGIGGRVAEVVGRKLQELASRNQVICVTHLPQIASFGSTHFRVWKEDVDGRTTARIARLDSRDDRILEIARMLGGPSVSHSAMAHATGLVDAAAAKTVARRPPSAASR
jgi:DNA repair protein RecN (Recombination protein N)